MQPSPLDCCAEPLLESSDCVLCFKDVFILGSLYTSRALFVTMKLHTANTLSYHVAVDFVYRKSIQYPYIRVLAFSFFTFSVLAGPD